MLEYVEPIEVNDIQECRFYHSIDLPNGETIEGDWDLRGRIGEYLGNYSFFKKRVLDIGAASGFLTFSMERQGAEVTSFDLANDGKWDIVPHYRLQSQMQELNEIQNMEVQKVKKSYWYSHQRLQSSAKAYYGDVYNLPDELGKFDVVVLGMIISHLRDPFQALYSASRLSTDTIIIVNQAMPSDDVYSYFMPDPAANSFLELHLAWWAFSVGCIKKMLGVLGFEVQSVSTQKYESKYREVPEECTTFIAKRIQ